MSNRQGVWSLAAQYQAIADQDWTMAPGAPTGVSGTAGDTQSVVSFTAPTFAGIPATITGFKVTSSSGQTATGSSSPITVTGLTNGNAVTFTVQAQNAIDFGIASAASSSVTPAVPVIALRFGGNNSSNNPVNTIDKTDITTLGNAVDFGDMNVTSSQNNAAVGSSTRAVVAAAFKNDSENVNELSYKAFSSSGNTTDFGDLTRTFTQGSAASNATRGIFFGGDSSLVMDYITIGSTGNATDFGDMTGSGEAKGHCSCASPTRAVFFGGDKGNNSTNVIGYVTIGSTGNENDFGNLLGNTQRASGFSSETRGVCGGGFSGYSGLQNVIQYITISSTGNATDFGNLTATRKFQSAACSNTRGLFMGGEKSGSSYSNDIDYITVASTGDAADFGDLTESITNNIGACSNAHGGLQ